MLIENASTSCKVSEDDDNHDDDDDDADDMKWSALCTVS